MWGLGKKSKLGIKHGIQGYDNVYAVTIHGKMHYIYEEEGPLRGYGMGAHADYFYYYEISEEAYKQKVLPENASFICSLEPCILDALERVTKRIKYNLGENDELS